MDADDEPLMVHSRDYALGVGRIAILSAALEEAMQRAILRRLGGQSTERLLRNTGAPDLTHTFCSLYADAPGIRDFADDATRLFQQRNTVVHGVQVLDFAELWSPRIKNRKRGTIEDLPNLSELKLMVEGFRKALNEVWFFEETRDFGYNREALEAAVERHYYANQT